MTRICDELELPDFPMPKPVSKDGNKMVGLQNIGKEVIKTALYGDLPSAERNRLMDILVEKYLPHIALPDMSFLEGKDISDTALEVGQEIAVRLKGCSTAIPKTLGRIVEIDEDSLNLQVEEKIVSLSRERLKEFEIFLMEPKEQKEDKSQNPPKQDKGFSR
jgi:hypothetical protein